MEVKNCFSELFHWKCSVYVSRR